MIKQVLYSEDFAIGIIFTITGTVTMVLSVYIGWMGMLLVGLVGLIITNRIELYDGYAVSGDGYGSTEVGLLARQMEIRRKETKNQRRVRKALAAKIKNQIYIANTGFIAMVAYGFSMFMTHQL